MRQAKPNKAYSHYCFNYHAPTHKEASDPWYDLPLLVVDIPRFIETNGIEGCDVNLQFEPPANLFVTCLSFQLEQCPTTSRVHIQGYAMFKIANMRIVEHLHTPEYVAVFGKPHWESCFGNTQQNLKYTSKETADTGGRINGTHHYYKRWGEEVELVASRKRARTESAGDDTRKQREERSIAADELIRSWMIDYADPQLPDKTFSALLTFVIMHAPLTVTDEDKKKAAVFRVAKNKLIQQQRVMETVFMEISRKLSDDLARRGVIQLRRIYVQVFQGKSGTGKSFAATANFPDYGAPYVKNCSDQWWSGFTSQHKHLILEEFSGHGADHAKPIFSVEFTLRLLDGLPLRLDPKLDKQVDANYVLVTITTNIKFDRWFGGWVGIAPEHKKAIKSRINEWKLFEGEDKRAAEKTNARKPLTNTNTTISYTSY